MSHYAKDPLIEGANLNFAKARILNDREGTAPILRGHTEIDASAFVQAYCGDITPSLVARIKEYDAVLACCAWLTNADVLEALASRKEAMAIVQKEDFLRPDHGQSGDWKARLRELYDALPGVNQYTLGEASHFSMAGSWGYDSPVRCVGVAGINRNRVTPKMHHKFFVFCDLEWTVEPTGYEHYTVEFNRLVPRAVWTGSLNASGNAVRSRENAVFIESEVIAGLYFVEFGEMVKISEALDWRNPWIDPGLSEGT